MSKREPNPTWIGLFVLGAAALGIATVLFLGSMRLFSKELEYVLYFDESVNGLSVGAPVKINGVPIGRVSDILIRYNQAPDSSAIPVFVKVARGRLRGLGAGRVVEDEDAVELEIWRGLRGHLQMESIITGQLYVELSYIAEPRDNPPVFRQVEPLMQEIPTVPSVLARIGSETTDLFARIASVDYQGISQQLVGLLAELRGKVDAVDTAVISVELSGLLQDARASLQAAQLKETFAAARATLASLEQTSEQARGDLSALLPQLSETALSLQAGLDKAGESFALLNQWLHPASPVRADFESSLRSLARMVEHLADLVELIERNPAVLIRGRTE